MEDDKDKGCILHCDINDSPFDMPVYGMPVEFDIAPEQYVHIDLELPDEASWLEDWKVEATVSNSEIKGNACFDKFGTPLFIDGTHLHCPPFSLDPLFENESGDEIYEFLDIVLLHDDEIVLHETVGLAGKTDGRAKAMLDREEADVIMQEIRSRQGWGSFKARMEEVRTRCDVGSVRRAAGLAENPPRLHTAVIGNPGTGKTSCVRLMSRLYKALGLLDNDEIHTINVSSLTTSSVNSETVGLLEAVREASGGTLVIDRAHELFRTDTRGNYDTEGRIVRAMVDAINDAGKYGRWMLVLVGEPEGMEYLLSNYQELARCLTSPIYMEDFTPDELCGMAGLRCESRSIKMSESALDKFRMYILHKYNRRGPGFQNAVMVERLIDDEIIPAMYRRLAAIPDAAGEQLETVLPEDIPAIGGNPDAPMAELEELIGMGMIKSKVKDYLNAVRLASRRMEMGLPTNMPRLHMAFLGNPGTGKTTVAEIIGRVFASWGILSGGRVIRTEKSQLVGQYIGETEYKMVNLLARARGNILFIDEAYQLVEGHEKDHGRIVMNSLLTALGQDNLDMVVILAGYTAPMKRLLESNEGIESRFPNVFNFEDYTTDELLEIGKLMIRRQHFTLTDGALANMRAIIEEEAMKPSPRFGNGRFVSNLLQNEILATLGARTSGLENPTLEDLSTILPEDVVVGKAQKDVVFDDTVIDAALARLDALAGMEGVKKAIHNFVQSARYLHSIGEPYVGKGLLSWRFIGKTGTGKSTVAEIMALILRGMRLISNSHITQIKGERIFGVADHVCDEVLRDAVKRACNGLIFIDVDDPGLGEYNYAYGSRVEQIHLKIKELTVESGGECALIMAELDAPNRNVAEQLSDAGVYEFDHTLVFKDYTPDELYQVLCICLARYDVTFSPAAEKHIRAFIVEMHGAAGANARTMKLMSRTIYQQVILRESGLARRPRTHEVKLSDIETFRWNRKKGRIGY